MRVWVTGHVSDVLFPLTALARTSTGRHRKWSCLPIDGAKRIISVPRAIQKVCMDSDFTQFEIKKQFHSFIIRHLQKNVQVIWRKWEFSFATRSILICDDIFWSKYKRKYKGIPLNFGPMTCWLAKTQYHFDSFMK